MAFIYNLTDSWTDAATTWNGIKLAVTNTSSDASSKLLNLTVTGATTASFVVDKSGNLALNGTVNKITFTAPATGATLTLADGSSFITSGAYSTTFTTTGTTTLTLPTSGTVTALGNTTTGSGSIVLATSPSLVTPALGTPSSGDLSNCTAYSVGSLAGAGTGVLTALAVNVGTNGSFIVRGSSLGTPSSGELSNCTGYVVGNLSGLGTGVATWLGTPSSANLAAAVTDETGSGSLVFATSPTLVTPNLGTPSAATLTNATGLPLTTGVTGTLPVANGGTGITSFGTGVATALGQNVTGSGGIVLATSPSLTTPNLGTPSAATLTNATGLPISTGVSGLGSGVATFLATPSSANLASAVTDETGTGPLVFATSPTFTSDITLGTQGTTQGSLVLANTSSTYSATLKSSNSASASYTLTLPATAPVNGYYLQTDTNGVLSWAAGGGGGGGSPGGSNTQVQFNDSANFGGAAAFTYNKTTYTLGLGVASTTTGKFALYNSASANALTLQAGNNASAWSLTFPTSAGTSGQALTTDGSGNTTWTTIQSGLAVASTTISGGTSGRILYDNAGVLGEKTVTGTGDVVLATSPTLVTPALGTPSSGTLTSCTGLPIATGVSGLGTSVATALAVNVGTAGAVVVNGGALGTPSSGTLTSCTGLPISTGVSGLGTNVASFLATPSSANLASAVTDETGSGALVFANTPTLISPILGTPTSGTLTNCTGLPVSTGVSGLGTSVATALAVNVGTAGAFVVNGGALGTPSSGTLTNCTNLPISTGVSGLGSGVATFLATPSSANLAAAVTDETGTGALVFGTNPTITNYTEAVVAIGNTGTSKTIDLTNGTVQTATLTGNCTFTMPTATAGKSFVLILNTGSSAYTATFTSVKWPNNTAPTITAGSATTRYDILSFFADGTNWYGSFVQAFQ